jgi:hypothetical protein
MDFTDCVLPKEIDHRIALDYGILCHALCCAFCEAGKGKGSDRFKDFYGDVIYNKTAEHWARLMTHKTGFEYTSTVFPLRCKFVMDMWTTHRKDYRIGHEQPDFGLWKYINDQHKPMPLFAGQMDDS